MKLSNRICTSRRKKGQQQSGFVLALSQLVQSNRTEVIISLRLVEELVLRCFTHPTLTIKSSFNYMRTLVLANDITVEQWVTACLYISIAEQIGKYQRIEIAIFNGIYRVVESLQHVDEVSFYLYRIQKMKPWIYAADNTLLKSEGSLGPFANMLKEIIRCHRYYDRMDETTLVYAEGLFRFRR